MYTQIYVHLYPHNFTSVNSEKEKTSRKKTMRNSINEAYIRSVNPIDNKAIFRS